MMEIWMACAAVVLSYLAGGIPFGLLAAKLAGGVDLRAVGSGNIGATNVYRALGLKWALAVFIADGAKGFLPVLAARLVGLPPWAAAAAGVAAVAGHVINPYLKGKGGKGVATAFGAVMGFSPIAGLIAFGVWLLVSALTKIISAGSLAAALALPLAMWLVTPEPAFRTAAFILSGLVIIAHRENLARLIRGEEKKIGRAGKTRAGEGGR